jgi:poly-gamma-glutamate capsule biosynthesis protein CapA/YwtB (metallophosphatase superfamily)
MLKSRACLHLLILLLLLLEACTHGNLPSVETPPPSRPATSTSNATCEIITLALAGDVMLARYVNQTILAKGPRHIWGDVLPIIQEADLSLINLECAIAESGEPFIPPRAFYFRAAPEVMHTLDIAGIDYVTLSNNHTMDYQAPALLETIGHLDDHGIAHAGAGGNIREASQPAVLEAKGIKVGVVAFADHFEEYAATDAEPGTNIIPITLDEAHFHRVRESIQAARTAGADLVIFSIHWGPNFTRAPSEEFVDFAHSVIDAGADIFHGHSAHMFHGIEIYRGKPILYDTGDLINDYYVDRQYRNDQQLLFLIRVTCGQIEQVELFPIQIHELQLNRTSGGTFDEITERIETLSLVFETEIARENDRLVIKVRSELP